MGVSIVMMHWVRWRSKQGYWSWEYRGRSVCWWEGSKGRDGERKESISDHSGFFFVFHTPCRSLLLFHCTCALCVMLVWSGPRSTKSPSFLRHGVALLPIHSLVVNPHCPLSLQSEYGAPTVILIRQWNKKKNRQNNAKVARQTRPVTVLGGYCRPPSCLLIHKIARRERSKKRPSFTGVAKIICSFLSLSPQPPSLCRQLTNKRQIVGGEGKVKERREEKKRCLPRVATTAGLGSASARASAGALVAAAALAVAGSSRLGLGSLLAALASRAAAYHSD